MTVKEMAEAAVRRIFGECDVLKCAYVCIFGPRHSRVAGLGASSRGGVVRLAIWDSYGTTGAGLATHPGGQNDADLCADRFGQDSRCISRLY